MTISLNPSIGQVAGNGKSARKVVEIKDSEDGIIVAWQKPDSDWVTHYVKLKSWLRWASVQTRMVEGVPGSVL